MQYCKSYIFCTCRSFKPSKHSDHRFPSVLFWYALFQRVVPLSQSRKFSLNVPFTKLCRLCSLEFQKQTFSFSARCFFSSTQNPILSLAGKKPNRRKRKRQLFNSRMKIDIVYGTLRIPSGAQVSVFHPVHFWCNISTASLTKCKLNKPSMYTSLPRI